MELIVVISIFSMITMSLVSNYHSSTKTLVLNTLARQIVTEIRRTQTFAMGNVKASSLFPSYGLYADMSNPNSLIFFVDLNGNHLYDGGAELAETIKFSNANYISDLRVNMKKDPPNGTSVTKLTIVFTRPYPEPAFIPTPIVSGAPYSDGEIILSGTGSSAPTKTIVLWITGQLAVE